MFPEVGLNRFGPLKHKGRFALQGCPGDGAADAFLPLLNGFRCVGHFDGPHVILERHPAAEPFLKEGAQSGLVCVVICGAQQGARERASRDVGKVALGRVLLNRLLAVESILESRECRTFQGLPGNGQRSILPAPEQCGRIFFHRNLHTITGGILQKQTGQREHGIGVMRATDFFRDFIETMRLRNKFHRDLRGNHRGGLGLGPGASIPVAAFARTRSAIRFPGPSSRRPAPLSTGPQPAAFALRRPGCATSVPSAHSPVLSAGAFLAGTLVVCIRI